MRLGLAIVTAIAVIAMVLWWLLPGGGPRRPSPVTGEPSDSRSSESSALAQDAARPPTRPIRPLPFTESRPNEGKLATTATPTVLKGRCVAATTREPLAGCRASLNGAQASWERMEKHVARNGKVEWRDPDEQTTAANGRFEFSFVAPPPYEFFLDLHAPGCAAMTGRWRTLAAGEVVDVGDVAMQEGVSVRGRVVDEAGSGQPQISGSVDSGYRSKEKVAVRPYESFHTAADGSFTLPDPLPAGKFTIDVREPCELVEPRTFQLAEGEAERVLEIKVHLQPDAEAIIGKVVDDAGGPVARADVDYSPKGGLTHRLVSSDKSGAFRIQRGPEDPKGPVSVTVSCNGHEPAPAATRCAWGSKGVILTLRRGLGVEVFVQDGDKGVPLEHFAVRCFPVPTNKWSLPPGMVSGRQGGLEIARLRDKGIHPNGVLHVTGICRGRQLLVVEPEGTEWLPSACHVFDMTDAGAPRQVFTVWRSLKKTVRVRTEDHAPVVGTAVDLLRRMNDEVVDEQTQGVIPGPLMLDCNGRALLLADGRTGADGTTEIAGPPNETLVLRALGPGHAPVVRDVVFDPSDGVIDIVVPRGATLYGHVLPLELIPQLDPREASERARSRRGMIGSGLSLRRPSPGSGRDASGYAPSPIGADGAFRIEGIPPGRWEVLLHYTDVVQENGASSTGSNVIGTVDLSDGQELEKDYDLKDWLKATIEGTLTLDGNPVEECFVRFEGSRLGSSGAAGSVLCQGIKVGPRGRFQASLWPGDYRLNAQLKVGEKRLSIYDAGPVRVAPGEQLQHTFELRSSLLKLRVLAKDGTTPVAGIDLELGIAFAAWPVGTQRTDARGMVDVEGLPAGPLAISVRPKRLSTPEAMEEFYRVGKEKMEDVMVQVTSLDITPPETVATIVLPASAGY